MNKRIITIMLCMVLVVSICGCGKKKDSEETPAPTEEVQTLERKDDIAVIVGGGNVDNRIKEEPVEDNSDDTSVSSDDGNFYVKDYTVDTIINSIPTSVRMTCDNLAGGKMVFEETTGSNDVYMGFDMTKTEGGGTLDFYYIGKDMYTHITDSDGKTETYRSSSQQPDDDKSITDTKMIKTDDIKVVRKVGAKNFKGKNYDVYEIQTSDASEMFYIDPKNGKCEWIEASSEDEGMEVVFSVEPIDAIRDLDFDRSEAEYIKPDKMTEYLLGGMMGVLVGDISMTFSLGDFDLPADSDNEVKDDSSSEKSSEKPSDEMETTPAPTVDDVDSLIDSLIGN